MPDKVWRPSEPPSLRSYNGFGAGFKGFTRADGSGRCFATCWLMVLYLPVVPLRRYYIREGETRSLSDALGTTTTTRYSIEGESRLRVIEVVRTYVFWLVALAFVVVPALVTVSWVNQVLAASPDSSWGIGIMVAAPVWLVVSYAALAILLSSYRKRWAPVRDVVWVDPPAPSHWQAPLVDRRDWDWDDD